MVCVVSLGRVTTRSCTFSQANKKQNNKNNNIYNKNNNNKNSNTIRARTTITPIAIRTTQQ